MNAPPRGLDALAEAIVNTLVEEVDALRVTALALAEATPDPELGQEFLAAFMRLECAIRCVEYGWKGRLTP